MFSSPQQSILSILLIQITLNFFSFWFWFFSSYDFFTVVFIISLSRFLLRPYRHNNFTAFHSFVRAFYLKLLLGVQIYLTRLLIRLRFGLSFTFIFRLSVYEAITAICCQYSIYVVSFPPFLFSEGLFYCSRTKFEAIVVNVLVFLCKFFWSSLSFCSSTFCDFKLLFQASIVHLVGLNLLSFWIEVWLI